MIGYMWVHRDTRESNTGYGIECVWDTKLRQKWYVNDKHNMACMRYTCIWCYAYYTSNEACTYKMHVQVQVEMYECKLKCVPVHENHGMQLHTCDCIHVLCEL